MSLFDRRFAGAAAAAAAAVCVLSCYCIRDETEAEMLNAGRSVPRQFEQYPMSLSHPDDDLGAPMLLMLPTEVVHRIDFWSPLSHRNFLYVPTDKCVAVGCVGVGLLCRGVGVCLDGLWWSLPGVGLVRSCLLITVLSFHFDLACCSRRSFTATAADTATNIICVGVVENLAQVRSAELLQVAGQERL